jgi:Gpi18-like mannosyltransferase
MLKRYIAALPPRTYQIALALVSFVALSLLVVLIGIRARLVTLRATLRTPALPPAPALPIALPPPVRPAALPASLALMTDRLARLLPHVRTLFPVAVFTLILALALAIRLDHAPRYTHGDQGYFFSRWADSALRDTPWAVYYYQEANHPPMGLYLMWLSAIVYEMDGSDIGVIDSEGMRMALKLPGIAFDMIMIVGAWWLVWRASGARWAHLVALALAFNPVVIIDSAMWGQTDGILTTFLLFSLGALYHRRYGWAWGLWALALLTKFQAVVLLPLLVVATLWPRTEGEDAPPFALFGTAAGWQALWVGVRSAVLIVVFVMLPFVAVSGRAALVPFTGAVDDYPLITLTAYNFWFWVSGGYANWDSAFPAAQDDRLIVLGNLSARTVGFGLLSLFVALFMLRALTQRHHRNEYLFGAALYIAFFMLPTQIHERYIYPAIPLLAMAIAHRRAPGVTQLDWRVLFLYITFTITGTYNLFFYFPSIDSQLHVIFNQLFPGGRNVVAAANMPLLFATLLFVLWPDSGRVWRLPTGSGARLRRAFTPDWLGRQAQRTT